MSDDFTIDLYDAVVAYHNSDADLVDTFLDQVRSHVSINGQEPAVVGLADALLGSQTKYKGLEQTVKNSTILMIFVTTRYAEDSTAFDTFVSEHFVTESLENEKSYVLPVWVEWDEKVKKPFAIRTWTGCHYRTADDSKNLRFWKCLKKEFESKKSTRKDKEMERARLIDHLNKMKELKKQERDRRQDMQRKYEKEQMEAELRKPVPRPRGIDRNRVASSDDVISASLSRPHRVDVHMNVNIDGVTTLQRYGSFGQHMPSAPSSSTTSSIPSSSNRSSRSSTGSQSMPPTAARRTSNETATTASQDGHMQTNTRRTSGSSGAENCRRASEELYSHGMIDRMEDLSINFDLTNQQSVNVEEENVPMHNLDSTNSFNISSPASSPKTLYADEMLSQLPSEEPQLDSPKSLKLM